MQLPSFKLERRGGYEENLIARLLDHRDRFPRLPVVGLINDEDIPPLLAKCRQSAPAAADTLAQNVPVADVCPGG